MLPKSIKIVFFLLSFLPNTIFGNNNPTPKSSLSNIAPILIATGNQIYCPATSMNIVTDFTITDPDDTGIDALYIQISQGYVSGQDQLILTGLHPTIAGSWNPTLGKLTLTGVASQPTYNELIAAVKDIKYSSSSSNPSGIRNFSITVGQANYLPSNGHYYQFIPNLGVTWSSAKNLAQTSTYYGLQGYLATITSLDEAKISGEQASGAGWIGGSDEQQEGVWKWMTGPEVGTIFWNGLSSGSTPNFAFWNSGEPNNLGDENYAHITAPGVGLLGSWNDLSNSGGASGNYQPKGYIVEYGGMPGDPVLQISTSTTITIPSINGIANLSSCGPSGLTLSASASNGIVNWYSTPSGGTPIASGDSFTTPFLTTTKTYYVDAYPIGCLTGIRTSVTATINEIPTITATNPSPTCKGFSATLSALASVGIVNWYNAISGGTIIATGTNFTTPILNENTTYYAEANNNGCLSINRIPINVNVVSFPAVNDETITICKDEIVTLNAGITNYDYLWSTGATTQTILSNGLLNYSVVITSPEGCTKTKNFTLIENPIPVIKTILVDELNATIITENSGNFEYSIDGINYQNPNTFSIPQGGLFTAFVRDNKSCGEDKEDFIILLLPKFFTPNNDGFNDFWTVDEMKYYPTMEITIFDRYGKLLTKLMPSNPTWDGKLTQKPMPADDYWYILKIDNTQPERKGHFSIIR